MVMKINHIMQKDSVTIAIINMEELKNLGIVHMINFTQAECVKTVILIYIIRRKERKS